MSSNDMTVKKIKKQLDELGVEYNSRALKEDLLKLLDGHTNNKQQEETKNKPKQKSYVVVHRFKDLQDNNKIYRPGDKFDHVGKTKERIAELSSAKNKIGRALIKETD